MAKKRGWQPSAPKVVTWFVCLVLGGLGLLGTLAKIPPLSGYAFWLVTAGWAVLMLATAIKGL